MLDVRKTRGSSAKDMRRLKKTSTNDEEKASGSQERKESSRNSRSVKITEFPKYVEAKISDSSCPFSTEYELLARLSPQSSVKEAVRPQNMEKNRYINILPFDSSRVRLTHVNNDPSSDYINANYISGYRYTTEYIASQGPLPNTKNDFWRMVWETSSPMIVMVAQCIENRKVKCDQYWPTDNKFQSFGEIKIRLKSTAASSGFTMRIFQLQKDNKDREVKQLHFIHWPDFGCPESTHVLINFVIAVRDILGTQVNAPIIVHCSAGVGRTGTFIALDILFQQIESEEEIDIFNLILEMRKQRAHMVQSEEQYIYIHDCLKDFIIEKFHFNTAE